MRNELMTKAQRQTAINKLIEKQINVITTLQSRNNLSGALCPAGNLTEAVDVLTALIALSEPKATD